MKKELTDFSTSVCVTCIYLPDDKPTYDFYLGIIQSACVLGNLKEQNKANTSINKKPKDYKRVEFPVCSIT